MSPPLHNLGGRVGADRTSRRGPHLFIRDITSCFRVGTGILGRCSRRTARACSRPPRSARPILSAFRNTFRCTGRRGCANFVKGTELTRLCTRAADSSGGGALGAGGIYISDPGVRPRSRRFVENNSPSEFIPSRPTGASLRCKASDGLLWWSGKIRGRLAAACVVNVPLDNAGPRPLQRLFSNRLYSTALDAVCLWFLGYRKIPFSPPWCPAAARGGQSMAPPRRPSATPPPSVCYHPALVLFYVLGVVLFASVWNKTQKRCIINRNNM